MKTVDTSWWLLANLARCRRCEQPLTTQLSGRSRRFYQCRPCRYLHPAEPLEQGVTAAAMERDWILAQHTNEQAEFAFRWATPTRTDLRRHLQLLLAAVVITSTSDHATLHWKPAFALADDSPWLGLYSGPLPAGLHPTLCRTGEPACPPSTSHLRSPLKEKS